MYLGEILGNGMFFLLFIAACLYINYLIIKLAVKHAIKSMLPEFKSTIRDSISSSITKYEWDKNK